MLYTHPDCRRTGTASALIKAYATECYSKGGIPYYVCANSEASAKLAQSLGIKEVRKEPLIYRLI
jgi:predicted GNAT family acetyltransferase